MSEQPSQQEFDTLIALFNASRLAEAARLAEAFTERFPQHWLGWKMLGVLHMQAGRSAEALLPMQKAAMLLPDDAETYNNLGIACNDLGRKAEAETSFRRALAINTAYAQAHSNLGACLQDMDRLDEAEACYRRALALQPTYARARNNLGAVLQRTKRLDEAEACFRQALQIAPDHVDALDNLAGLLYERGEKAAALETVKQSLQLGATVKAKNLFVASVKHLHPTEADHELRRFLAQALSEPWDRPVDLARVSADFIKLEADVGACVTQGLFDLHCQHALAEDSLLSALLTSTPVCDIELERFLTTARHTMLAGAATTTPLNFLSALAQQCFINEYVFALTGDELRQASALRDALMVALETDTAIPPAQLLLAAACFPLHSLPLSSRLLNRQWPEAASEAVMPVLTQQIVEPAIEQALRADMPRLNRIEDEISLRVQNQYEENPYPRWIKAAPVDETFGIDVYLKHKFPLAAFHPHETHPKLDILIAGCGTGQHSISRAQTLLNAQVLAIDLSLGSLAYAKRKTQELGLNNIEYAQADLLKLASLGRDFDVVESVGVLHHLADPWAGWRALLPLLRPGGFMKLGFYSELARRHIVRARSFIAERGYEASLDGIRRCRQELMSMPVSPSPQPSFPHPTPLPWGEGAMDKGDGFDRGNLLRVSDFFSTSACRDLLFHVQEHRLSLDEIKAFLDDNALTFLGFEVEPEILEAYQRRFPDDQAATNLALWQIFEHENPDIFFGMYQFWIQK